MVKQNKVASNLQQDYTEAEKAQARRNIGLAEVAHTGDYNDLVNRPQQISGQVQSDWEQTNENAVDFIRHKPTIPTVNDGTLTIKRNGTTVATFSANSATDVTANVAVPTKTSDISNDSGFITSADLPTVGNGTVTVQKNGSYVGSFTMNQSSNKTINITVPVKTSEITNDSGFITSADLPSVGNGTITIQKNNTDVDSFTTNQSSNKTINISVPEYTAGTDVKISNQNAISSLHGLKSYSRTQPTGDYGDMVEDSLVSGVYHICPPTIVDNNKKNNLVYEYKVTNITNCLWIDLPYALTPDADGFVANLHYIIDLTGNITDDSDPLLVPGTHDSLILSVGYGNTKAQLANYSARYIPIYIGKKYLVDFYGNVAHVTVLGENRIQDISPNWGDVQEYLSTTPNTTHHDISYKLENFTAYHMDIYTTGLQAESTDKYRYRVALGVYGSQNIRYLTGWIRQDSGKSLNPHLDFTSDQFTSMFIEFDQTDYPMATQTVNLNIMGTKERF